MKKKSKMRPESEKLYLEFKHYRENVQNKKFDQIKASIENFLIFVDNIPFNELTRKHYADFLKKMIIENGVNKSTIENYNANLTSFLEFLQSKGHTLQFISIRQEILSSVIEELNPSEKRKGTPLDLDEWASLRQMLEQFEEYEKLFFLEVIYQYDLTNTSQIKEFHALNYFDGLFHITKNNETSIYEPSTYLKMLIEKGGMPLKPLKEGTLAYRFNKIRDYINRTILIGDITLTRSQNFFTCPKCKKSYENIPENWVVFDYGKGHLQAIVCRKVCYEEAKN